MPVETLCPPHSGLKGAPLTHSCLKPCTPHSNLKGALFLLRPRSPRRRLSAVERLEADKAKYVKSQQVALTRQAPVIRKALLLPPGLSHSAPRQNKAPLQPGLSCPAPRQKQSPLKHAVWSGRQRSSARESPRGRCGASLDLGLLSDLIGDVCDGACSPSGTQSGSSSSPSSNNNSGAENVPPTDPSTSAEKVKAANGPREESSSGLKDSKLSLLSFSSSLPICSQATPPPLPPRLPQAPPPPLPPRPLAAVVPMAIRRVDVRPQTEVRTPGRRPLQPRPSLPPPPHPPSPALTRLSHSSTGSAHTRGSAHRRKLQRSQSDLSERFSRASAERERFFNLCGLDIEPTAASPTASPLSLTAPSLLRSASTKSEEREEREGRASERVPYGISVIERNARVIKWLYGLRQAREEE